MGKTVRVHPADPQPEFPIARPRLPEVTITQVRLPLNPGSPKLIREHAADMLKGAAVPARAAHDVVVAVGELATASFLAGAATIELGIEVAHDGITAIVRDDRHPGWQERLPPSRNAVREALLDAITSTRTVVENQLGVVTVARFGNHAT
jgi:hypothetical protein